MIRRAKLLPLVLLLVLPLVLPFSGIGCGGGGTAPTSFDPVTGVQPDDNASNPGDPTPTPTPPPPPPPPTPPGTPTSQPRVPLGSTPPVGLTWYVGYTENATAAQLQGIYSQVLSLNTALWNVTEGQVYIWRVIISDNVAPGVLASAFYLSPSAVQTSGLDIVIWPTTNWDLGGIGGWVGAHPSVGRAGVIMALPSNASTTTWLHETGHFAWNLSWTISFGLEDEYNDGAQDPACVMEQTYAPLRWCSSTNHVTQGSQPHSCWTQILNDYANFGHTDTDTAASSPWRTLVTYNDVP